MAGIAERRQGEDNEERERAIAKCESLESTCLQCDSRVRHANTCRYRDPLGIFRVFRTEDTSFIVLNFVAREKRVDHNQQKSRRDPIGFVNVAITCENSRFRVFSRESGKNQRIGSNRNKLVVVVVYYLLLHSYSFGFADSASFRISESLINNQALDLYDSNCGYLHSSSVDRPMILS